MPRGALLADICPPVEEETVGKAIPQRRDREQR